MAEEIKIGYDREGDVLEIFFGEPVPSIAHEVTEGVFLRRSINDVRLTGITILSLTKRFKDLELMSIPLEHQEDILQETS
ncbi:hypothetical protein FJZ31_33895 [Candidatus Poribacteria bacterium]|nr:hypothetical protein [Candidatus Poribacteria bacterium]